MSRTGKDDEIYSGLDDRLGPSTSPRMTSEDEPFGPGWYLDEGHFIKTFLEPIIRKLKKSTFEQDITENLNFNRKKNFLMIKNS